MKTFRFLGITLFALAICLGFSSCSSDDDEIGDVSNIIGTWQIVHSTGWYINEDGEKETWDDDESDYRYVFKENNVLDLYTYSSYTESWRKSMSYNYSVSGNKISIENLPTSITIKSLNSSTLVLVEEETDYYEVVTFVRVNE